MRRAPAAAGSGADGGEPPRRSGPAPPSTAARLAPLGSAARLAPPGSDARALPRPAARRGWPRLAPPRGWRRLAATLGPCPAQQRGAAGPAWHRRAAGAAWQRRSGPAPPSSAALLQDAAAVSIGTGAPTQDSGAGAPEAERPEADRPRRGPGLVPRVSAGGGRLEGDVGAAGLLGGAHHRQGQQAQGAGRGGRHHGGARRDRGQPDVRLAEGRAGGRPRRASGHSEIARSACAVIVSEGLTPRLALTAAPSTTCRPGAPYTRWYGSTTPVAGESPMAQPPRMCAVIGTLSTSPTVPPAWPPMWSGDPADGVVADRDPRRVGRAVAGAAGEPAGAGAAHGDRVVEGLHDQRDDRALAPAPDRQAREQQQRVQQRLQQEAQRARHPAAAVDEQRREQAHRVAARAVAARLDVGVLVRVERAR